jgi:DNA helicase IV
MRRIKGLEFKAVAMLAGSNADGEKRLERYVAATRARQWLLIVDVQ